MEMSQDMLDRFNDMVSQMSEGFPTGILAYTLKDHNILFLNEEACHLSGYSKKVPETVAENFVMKNVLPEDIPLIEKAARKLKDVGDVTEYSYRTKSLDGSIIYVFCTTKLCAFRDGTRYILSSLRDFTEKYLLTKTLEAERKQYHEALNKDSLSSFVVNVTDGHYANEVLADIDYSFLYNMGLDISSSYDEVQEAYRNKFGIQFLSERAALSFTVNGLLKMYNEGVTSENVYFYESTTDRYIRNLLLFYKNEATSCIMVTSYFYDITDERKGELEQQRLLRDALYEAEQASRAKTIFLNNMSHDIRTPMNAIMGYSSLATTHIDEKSKVLDYLSKIQVSSSHLLSLINDVLDMSRIESGKMQIHEERISLTEILQNIKSIVQSDVDKKHQTFDCETVSLANDFVYCDKLRLGQVLLNCISNAVKYTGENGKISLTIIENKCERAGYASYLFKIKDNGIGMSQKFKERVFEPFERERTATVSGIQGTGLGMSICKNIVEKMQGTISVESEKGKGSEFTVSLELRIADSGVTENTESKDTLKSAFGLKVLLVEDNEINREIAIELLKENGVTVVDSAENGIVAIKKIRTYKKGDIDAVLMDIQMPVMDGYEATSIIRLLPDKWQASIPIIAMTANAFEEDRRLAFDAGMNAHVVKPINITSLLETLLDVLSHQ